MTHKQTLDQQRAQFAWRAAGTAQKELGTKFSAYRNLSKGAPAMIMGNGLMASLAFYQSRGTKEAERLVLDLLGWLAKRGLKGSFAGAMSSLQEGDARFYMQQTEEALAVLRWLRQFADAVNTAE